MENTKTIALLFITLIAITSLYFVIFYIMFVEAEVCGDVDTATNWLSHLVSSCFG
jgi:hypothetical protein